MTEAVTTETETPEGPGEGQDGPQEPQEGSEAPQPQSTAPEAADAPPSEPEQPSEIADDSLDEKTVVKVTTPAGALHLRPNQVTLDPVQVQALIAIGIDTVKDPGIAAQVRPFMHLCQVRGLDPWAREAYLIGRGKGDNRKYTMQTGIDGYRKMGAATGRFIRVKKVLWTGRDDDDRSFVKVEDEDGDVIMKRVWFDQWPADRGNPGAAKVVIEHLDEDGQVTTTGAVANWEMYAPYNDLWEYDQQQRKRVQRFDSGGKPIKVLTEMWLKGGPHMLAKCAEALAYRMAFPARMSGIYTTEEMHRLDGQERDRRQNEQQEARRAAMRAARGQRPEQIESTESAAPDEVVDGEIVEEPTTAAAAVEETVEEIQQDEGLAKDMLMAELAWQADVLDTNIAALARRRVAALRKNVDEFTAAELLSVVLGARVATLAHLGDGALATRYEAAVTESDDAPLDINDVTEGSEV